MVSEQILRLFSSETLVTVCVALALETSVEGGEIGTWWALTILTFGAYQVANYVHEGTEDMVEELHDDMENEKDE